MVAKLINNPIDLLICLALDLRMNAFLNNFTCKVCSSYLHFFSQCPFFNIAETPKDVIILHSFKGCKCA